MHQQNEAIIQLKASRTITRIRIKPNSTNLSLENQTIPHFVPTADNGDPRLYLYIKFFNDKGEAVDSAKEIIAPQQETALPYNKRINFQYRLFDPVSRAVIELKYQSAWSKEKHQIFSKSVSR